LGVLGLGSRILGLSRESQDTGQTEGDEQLFHVFHIFELVVVLCGLSRTGSDGPQESAVTVIFLA
jgi:hypothetical protein